MAVLKNNNSTEVRTLKGPKRLVRPREHNDGMGLKKRGHYAGGETAHEKTTESPNPWQDAWEGRRFVGLSNWSWQSGRGSLGNPGEKGPAGERNGAAGAEVRETQKQTVARRLRKEKS